MSDRDKILNSIGSSLTAGKPLTDFNNSVVTWKDSVAKFSDVLRTIGGAVVEVQSYAGVSEFLLQRFGQTERVVSFLPLDGAPHVTPGLLHPLDNVEVSVIKGKFGVAENGCVWVTDDLLPDRVLPFICQHLVIVLNKYNLVNTMHDVYEKIGDSDYDFGTFIAGPSKTADIEQALVLGAHGPKTMTVFLVEDSPD